MASLVVDGHSSCRASTIPTLEDPLTCMGVTSSAPAAARCSPASGNDDVIAAGPLVRRVETKQNRAESMGSTHQAHAPATQPFGAEAFAPTDQTVLRWLGMAGFLVNSRGTTIMIDPLLGGFDMPIMIEMPLSPPMYRTWMPSWSPTATTTTTASQPAATWPTSPRRSTRRSTLPR